MFFSLLSFSVLGFWGGWKRGERGDGERADPRTTMCFLGERGEGGGIVDIWMEELGWELKVKGEGGGLGAGWLAGILLFWRCED